MMYEFGGETFLQMEGGPIGSRVTMAASRLVMQEWSEGYLDILERSGMRVDVLKGYVDDGRQAGDELRRGTRFNKSRMRFTWREDWERIDVEENLPTERRMGNICVEAMNAVNTDLTFTVESDRGGGESDCVKLLPEDHEDPPGGWGGFSHE